jgi:hypothetical protein
MQFLGFNISRASKDEEGQLPPSVPAFTPEQDDDGAQIVSGSGAYGQFIDMGGNVQVDSELITRYRTMSAHPSLDIAVSAIVNEAIVNEPEEPTVVIDLTAVDDLGEPIKQKITQEFNNILAMLNFELMGYEIFRRWYVDGRLFYHAMIDTKKPKEGIVELRYIDPRKIKKVREIKTVPMRGKTLVPGAPMDQTETVSEFYLFSEKGFGKEDLSPAPLSGKSSSAYKIAKDSIIQVTSGQMDPSGRSVISYLHKAIRPLNMVTMLEDSMVINRVVRGPERRIFYVDVSGMQKSKGEQYMKSVMNSFKNKVVYDSTTGEIRDNRKFMTMFEDFWLPRRDGGKSTEVVPLPGAQNMDQIADVEFAQQKLYQALGIPLSRFSSDAAFSLGRAGEISREEVAFEKFVTRLRSRFSTLFLAALRLQLILKGIMTEDDWEKIKNKITFAYAKDNVFAELKQNEVMMGRANLLMTLQPFIGRFYSNEYIRAHICKQTEEEIREIDAQIAKEVTVPQYQMPEEQDPSITT